jgi:hypothetical protein
VSDDHHRHMAKINLFNWTVMSWLGSITAVLGLLLWYLSGLPKEQIETISIFVGNSVLLAVIAGFLGTALFKKINVFESFIEGAKAGFTTTVTIIPYLVGLLVAISAFRSCGAMDYLIDGLKWMFSFTGFNTDFTDALASCINETTQRQRRTCFNDRRYEGIRARLVRRTTGMYFSGIG